MSGSCGYHPKHLQQSPFGLSHAHVQLQRFSALMVNVSDIARCQMAQAFAARRADISEELLQKERARAAELEATVAQLRLMLEEAGTAGEAARADLRAERQDSRRAAHAAAAAADAAAAEAKALQVRSVSGLALCEGRMLASMSTTLNESIL